MGVTESKFKKGDWVRCVDADGVSYMKYGDDIEPLTVASEAQPAAQDAPAAPAPLRIVAGRYYKTRDGRKVGPMEMSEWGGYRDRSRNVTSQCWSEAGTYIEGCTSNLDLIAEWVDTPVTQPPTNLAATVDAINDEYGPVVAVADVPVAKPKFKVGDRVRVVKISDSGHGRNLGEEFTLSVLMPGNETYGKFWRTSDGQAFYLDEIELIGPPTPAIVCLIDNSHPLPATRPRVHDSVELADKEAARLASVHKGQEFGVFAMTGTPHKVEKTYEHEWQRLAVEGRKTAAAAILMKLTGMHAIPANDAVRRYAA